MMATRTTTTAAVLGVLGAAVLALSGGFGRGMRFENPPDPAAVGHLVESGVATMVVAVSLVAIAVTAYRILRRRRSA